MTLKYNEVFTPNEQPVHSYVDREEHRLEQKLADHLETPGIVVSLSGPSKSGKTVLVRKMVSEDDMIPLSGSSIKSIGDFWSSLFNFLHAPSEIAKSKSAGGEISLGPRWLRGTGTTSESESEKIAIDPFRVVVDEIGGSDFVIFIDDFHYIESATQNEIAKLIKGLAKNGVKICTASVPHRNDDVVRANPELRGRLAAVDVEPWNITELVLIARLGFSALRYRLSEKMEKALAREAFATPQLMQAICMNLCRVCDLREESPASAEVEPTDSELSEAFKDTSDFANFATLTRKLHTGPKKHGKERKLFDFSDGSEGDVYRACLLAIANVGPKRSISYDDMMQEIKAECVESFPVGSSVNSTLGHMASICESEKGDAPVMEWDEDILSIVDPYFLFYLRKSDQLGRLADT